MTPADLVPLCTVDLTLERPHVIGDGPAGSRMVAGITGMELRGLRLTASLAGPEAADWLTIANGVASIDVRATVRTADGALVFVQYQGRSDVAGGLGSAPIYTAVRFETSDERYRWLNPLQVVGKGELGELRYEWYELR